MRIKKFLYWFKLALIITLFIPLLYGFKGDNKNGGKRLSKTSYSLNKVTSGKVGDAYRLNVNNINLPIDNKGVIANVDIPPLPPELVAYGIFAGHRFLYSSGFFLSGYKNGQLFANAVAPSTLVQDYLPGTVASGQTDPNTNNIYVLNSQDEPFGQSWQDWKDAVVYGGADYYDGDNNGQYDPVDLNGNGKWDPDEDAPDLLGDETAWCVYNDALPAAQRRWNTVDPLGIEVRQTVFAFASAGAIGNLVFIRYRFKYVGLSPNDPNELTDCYFSVWADPDLGEDIGFNTDLVGCDTVRNAGFDYHTSPAAEFGAQTPCFLIDFFSGPASYIPGETFIDANGNGIYDEGETTLDTAYSIRGSLKGVVSFPGARNLPISSFVEYINGDPDLNDPSTAVEARNYMLGLSRTGSAPDPCDWAYGTVLNEDCANIDNRFWYSGDPVAGQGWINTAETDQRMMQNTGPFTLRKGEEKEIVVAYVVGQGSSPISSVTVAKQIDDGAQFIFDNNFIAPSPAPPVNPQVTAGESFIDITWNTAPQVTFVDSTEAYNDHFEGYNVYAYKSNNTAVTINNISNRTLVARYTKADFINDLYIQDANTGGIELLYAEPDSAHQLDPAIYGDPETGRIRLRVTEDPFTGGRLVKGKPYYFSITSYCPNYFALVYKDADSVEVGTPGDYYISASAFVGNVENIAKISSIVLGENEYSPPLEIVNSSHTAGAASGNVGFDIVNQNDLRGDEYEVTFFRDSSTTLYSTFWTLRNATTNTILIDSSKFYSYESSNISTQVTDGFITRVQPDTAELGTPVYYPEANIWYKEFADDRATGVYYVGEDAGFAKNVAGFPLKRSNVISVDKLRKVELRFGANQNGKAYRYINGYKGLPASNSYFYAEAIEPSDTVGKGQIGNWDLQTDRPKGFVDVPFTAWVVDPAFGEQDKERQLAVGFIEKRKTASNPNGNPDGVWNPTDSLRISGEEIIIFNSDYDANGNQIQFTGGDFSTPGGTVTVWADMFKNIQNPPTVPPDAQGLTQEQIATFNSPWFNAMYVVGLEKQDPQTFYADGDSLVIPLAVYPYTSKDVFRFKTLNQATIDENAKKALFQKVNVFPNPLYGFNPATSYSNRSADEPFVTFSNLPEDVTITIYSLSGNKLRTLTSDPISPSPFLQWNLQNDSGLRVASGIYIAIVNSPKYGQKILKFSIIMPQKQLPRY